MALKNLPTCEAVALAELASVRPGRVQSVSFTPIDASASLVLLAFSQGESVSEEVYAADTLYYAVEGTALIVVEGRPLRLPPGAVLRVPAGTSHAVVAEDALKLLQIAVP